MAARELLQNGGIPAAVVSMPCTELFDQQDAAYRLQVLGNGLRIAVEAAAGYGWERYVGERGAVVGLSGFGASAPHQALYQHFGITAEKVAELARTRLG